MQGQASVGHPVNVATGHVYLTHRDVTVPGKIGLTWERRYNTSFLKNASGPIGQGWAVRYFSFLTVAEGAVEVLTPEGERERFNDPENLLLQGKPVTHFNTFSELQKNGGEYCLTQWNIDTREILKFCYASVPGSQSTFRLVRIENITGQALDMEWNAIGQLVSIRQRLEGRVLQLAYLYDGHLDSVTLVGRNGERRLVANHRYDEVGRLIQVTDCLGRHQDYSYDVSSRLKREVLKDGGVFHFRYDGQGRCVRTSGSNEFDIKTLRYLDGPGITLVTDSRGNTSSFHWLPSGQIKAEINPLGGRKDNWFDAYGRLVSRGDQNGSITSYQYDERGNRCEIKEPNGASTCIHYNDRHQPMEIIDVCGYKWTRVYDQRGNWIRANDPQQYQWNYEYDENCNLVRVTSPEGRQREYFYDEYGVLTAITNWKGRRTELRFDAFGRLVGQLDMDGKTTVLSRDIAGRLLSIQLRDESTSQFRYDSGDNLTAIIDRNGQTTRFRYGTCGRMIERVDALGQTRQFHWGTEPRQLEKIINENEEAYVFEYDAAGRVIRTIAFDGRVTEYEHDPAGNCLVECKGENLAVRYTYDAVGRIVKKEGSNGENATFVYDNFGRVIAAENNSTTLRYVRNYLGQIITESQGEHSIRHEFDQIGNLRELQTSIGLHAKFSYEEDGFLRSLSVEDVAAIKFEDDQFGRESKRELPGGLELWQTYNDLGQLSTQELGFKSSGFGIESMSFAKTVHALVMREFRYDVGGSLISLADASFGVSTYEYDAVQRLTKAKTPGAEEEFAYDGVGNTVTAFRSRTPDEVRYYDPGNRLTVRGNNRFVYDDCGRLVRRIEEGAHHSLGDWQFEWDAFDHLTSVVTPTGERWFYAYDPFGRRICKISSKEKIEFIWDGVNIIHEKSKDRVRSWIYNRLSGRVLAQMDGDQFFSVIVDHLGTPRELVDRSGQVVWQGSYWVWGVQKEGSRKWPTDCPLRFPGQYEDIETGLYYNCCRYYDPASGRYLSPDPSGLLGGLNEYIYCRNPVNWIDPLGLCSESDQEHVYQLVDEEGNVVYYGITNDPNRRAGEHAETKDFSRMEVLTDGLSHNDARNLESALIRGRLDATEGLNTNQPVSQQLADAGLLNQNRGRTPERVADNGGPANFDHIKDDGSRTTIPRPNR